MENNENQNKEIQNNEIIENENPLKTVKKVNEAINKLPENERRIFAEFQALTMQGVMPTSNPLVEKISPEHITTVLANVDKESERAYKFDILGKIIGSIVFVIILIAIVALIYVFRNHMNDISEILKMLIYGSLGAFGGYGFGLRKGKDE